jgi:hypothetical protein
MDITPEGFAQSVQHLQPLGTLVLSSTNGKVLTSSGDLQGEKGEKVRARCSIISVLLTFFWQASETIFRMLQDTSVILTSDEGEPQPFRKLSLTFKQYEFAITMSNTEVYVLKKSVN